MFIRLHEVKGNKFKGVITTAGDGNTVIQKFPESINPRRAVKSMREDTLEYIEEALCDGKTVQITISSK